MASKGISGKSVMIVTTGLILAWSAVRGWTVSGVVKDLIAGKDPRTDPALQNSMAVSAGGLATELLSGLFDQFGIGSKTKLYKGSGDSSSSDGTSIFGLGGSSVSSYDSSNGFAQGFLQAIGAPLTQANISSVNSWIRHEGGGGANNPLNTTLSLPGATVFNSIGVRNYSSLSQGIQANAQTVLGGRYSDIVAALRSGNGLCGRSWSGLSTWSGGGYSSVC